MRDATAADAGTIGRIVVTTWRAAYAGLIPDHVLAGLSVAELEQQWASWLPADPPRCCLVTGTPPVGFVGAGPAWQGPGGQVYAIYVDPAHWGAGHGGRLLRGAVDRLRAAGFDRATLWVLTTNAPARAFYEHEGWRATGRTQVEALHGADLPETEYELGLGLTP